MTTIRFTILGEPASKANSRKLVTVGKADERRTLFIKSAKARSYEHDALRQIPAWARQRLEGPVMISLRIFYASERPDLDPSVILDCLQDRWKKVEGERMLLQSGVVRNDRQFREMHLYHFIDRANPRAEIEIEPLAPQQVALAIDLPKQRQELAAQPF